ncbi:Ppx/GppA family phosphatase [Thermoanaerobacterium sp. DL9XJH110]|uniref:Ppx/GppA phosphatase family protein n=1 Tax=Thermoanaerobacterium sp. DL9XJH110 TaxID=3386643 RepID=UPI003BB551CD
MRFAVIDLGSNSARLLVADCKGQNLTPLHRELITTRLGRGVAKERRLDEPSMRDTLSAVSLFKDKAARMGCDRVLAFATSAVREAENGRDFLDVVKKDAGLDVVLLEGEREAKLSFIGARAGLGLAGMALVVDIGGGSTELTLGDSRIVKSVSLPMGAVKFTQIYFSSDPPAASQILAAGAAVEELLSDFAEFFGKAVPRGQIPAVGVGGTFTTLAAMVRRLEIYDPGRVHGFTLQLNEVERVFGGLCSMTLEEKKKIPGLMPQRADIIAAGTLIALRLMKRLNLPAIRVSEWDLMEGFIFESVKFERP